MIKLAVLQLSTLNAHEKNQRKRLKGNGNENLHIKKFSQKERKSSSAKKIFF